MSKRRNAAAYKVCQELIHGDGTADSLQRAIDLARFALGLEQQAGPLPTLPERSGGTWGTVYNRNGEPTRVWIPGDVERDIEAKVRAAFGPRQQL